MVNLLSFLRPSRYINSELNSIHKKAPVKVALAFPDLYEVGMSHLGLKILYHIINNIPYASAERAFAPWTDLEDAMRKEGVLLSSLESGLPLKDFDIVGFSLQYELSYTTVLNMLDLGGIPLRSEERMERRQGPLVIAGGPATLNPLPMSVFIDAFLIGDGEEAVPEILAIYHQWKNEGGSDRHGLLKALSAVEGVFVPCLGKDRLIRRRVVTSLEDAPYPDKPVVPFAGIIHDRVNIEIARGCSMGCRFCQAGMAYRPVRERSPEKVLELAERSLRNTGYEDVSFTSLSSGDYSCLPQLMQEFNRRFSEKRVSMSLPSLRVASVTSGMLREIKTVRKTGFTIAPEAGTERLRAVINKDFSEETYLNALEILFKEGWQNLKLYYMTGLPTETDADIAAIPEMVLQAIRTSKRLRGRNINISVGVSSFIPKPHTPFQWFGQNTLSVLKGKNSYLKKELLRRGVKYKGHAEEMSLLEAMIARGDETLSVVIEKAWQAGCRLDAWTEVFDFEKWNRAIEDSGVNAVAFAEREYSSGSVLPWEFISTGVTKDFLWREYQNAISEKFTSDCRKACNVCGLKCEPAAHEINKTTSSSENLTAPEVAAPEGRPAPLPQHPAGIGRNDFMRVRMEFSKTGRARYLSHLELAVAMTRALRRADLPLKYSGGFHPAPKISFGPALSVGIAGLREYLDIELIPPVAIGQALTDLNRTMPAGLLARRMVVMYSREKSLDSFIIRYMYDMKHCSGLSFEGFLNEKEVMIERKQEHMNIREMVEDIKRIDEETVRLTVRDIAGAKVRLDELSQAIFGLQARDIDITRVAMFGWDGSWVEPLEGEEVWAARS
ncbi:MAG: DUF2344 domain-containing protein [Nitrospirae bacterium]|nr:DUF2344 domain-containing protein [Nitrospirota bacterium]